MKVYLRIDDALVTEALKIGRHPTKKAAVIAALQEYIQRRKQKDILSLFKIIDFHPGYNYKTERTKK